MMVPQRNCKIKNPVCDMIGDYDCKTCSEYAPDFEEMFGPVVDRYIEKKNKEIEENLFKDWKI